MSSASPERTTSLALTELGSDLSRTVWLDSPGALAGDISVHGGQYAPRDGFEWELDAYVLILYVGGRARIRRTIGTNEQTCDARPGTLSLHPPLLPSRWDWDTPMDSVAVTIDPGFLRQIAIEEVGPGAATTMRIPPQLGIDDPALLKLGVELIEELTPPLPFASARSARAIGERIAIHILRHYTVFRTGRETTRTFATTEIAALRTFVAERLTDDVRVAEMASVVGLSEHHFFRVFRETFGKTPCDYLQAQRLDRARDLVVTTTKSIAEIATLTGFSDQSHLARCFKRRFNAPPSQLRLGVRPKL